MKYYSLRILPVILLVALWFGVTAYREMDSVQTLQTQDRDWPNYGGTQGGTRYSPLTQINLKNVKDLKVAWTFNTGHKGEMQTQPIVVNGVFYGVTPGLNVNRVQVAGNCLFALDPTTGKELWRFDPFLAVAPRKIPFQPHAVRGVNYWQNGNDKRILYSTGTSIFEVNALTGELIKTFGNNGEISMYAALDSSVLGYDPTKIFYRNTSPGAIYKDLFIVGASMGEDALAPPGYIQAFDVRTGKLRWVFHTFPLPGEYGYETWAKDSYKKLGGANSWSGMVMDENRGVVYASTGSASGDFYGGARPGKNLFANCVIALDAATGKRKWHYQVVHHDLWDKDMPQPPVLMTVTRAGKKVDAVAQATKDGYIFIFNRDTGVPLFPVKETPVPTTPALPGEQPWPTQPIPTKPAPFVMQKLTEETITDRTPEAHAYVLERFKNSLTGSKYVPPSFKGSLYFGFGGGAEYGGAAADPNGIFYVNGNNMLWWQIMTENPKIQTKGSMAYNTNCNGCHGSARSAATIIGDGSQSIPSLGDIEKRLTKEQIHAVLESGRGRMPSFSGLSKDDRESIVNYLLKTEPATATVTRSNSRYDSPYLSNGTRQFRDNEGYPAMKAPWGTLNAVNMNTGEYLWKVPLGEYPALTAKGVPQTGTENHGGPVVTAGGLLFIAATYDQNLRAYDTKTGKVVWQYKLPFVAGATPITYMKNGKQYIAIAAGGGRYSTPTGDVYIAFALPDQ